jgi:glyoxylase-like metal-dependent hydrolase (beta-lactamase superfamily II)
MIHIEHFTFNAFQERTLILWDNDGICAFVDPGFSTAAERDKMTGFIAGKNLKPACIMLTHAHFDHIYGVAELANTYNIPIYMHPREKHTIEVTNPYLCKAFGLPEPQVFEAKDLQENKVEGTPCIKVGSLEFEVIETPGHTPGGVCFLERNEKVLISGDTLFAGAIGRTDHPGGDYDLLMKSIFEKLMCLDGDITVIPGHGPDTSIADERMTNPFLLPFNEPMND